ncbi:MAG: hypothetical protein HS132_13885 [Planctomycetia bacterium]|nr:hypothetical protein [Planctomycetia bacterium]
MIKLIWLWQQYAKAKGLGCIPDLQKIGNAPKTTFAEAANIAIEKRKGSGRNSRVLKPCTIKSKWASAPVY